MTGSPGGDAIRTYWTDSKAIGRGYFDHPHQPGSGGCLVQGRQRARAVSSLRPPRDGLARRAVGGEGGAKAYHREKDVGSPRRELTRLLDGERRVEGQPPQTNDVRQRHHCIARARNHPDTQNRCDRARCDRYDHLNRIDPEDERCCGGEKCGDDPEDSSRPQPVHRSHPNASVPCESVLAMLIPGCFRIGCSSATISAELMPTKSATRPAMASLPKRSENGTGREQNPHEFYLLKLGGYTSGATSVNSIE